MHRLIALTQILWLGLPRKLICVDCVVLCFDNPQNRTKSINTVHNLRHAPINTILGFFPLLSALDLTTRRFITSHNSFGVDSLQSRLEILLIKSLLIVLNPNVTRELLKHNSNVFQFCCQSHTANFNFSSEFTQISTKDHGSSSSRTRPRFIIFSTQNFFHSPDLISVM